MSKPPFAATSEVRFALVMYGGSSLAIYINGVVQELFHLVRATAPSEPLSKPVANRKALLSETTEGGAEERLTGTEVVYRRLGQWLGSDKRSLASVNSEDPILTRFVVDILSGTSAGGINAVFLAKALANQQSLDQIKQLWLDEGDMQRLLNDSHSARRARFPKPVTPESLLGGQLMYFNLLRALDSMEARRPSQNVCISPYVEELDLYITATDIQGLTLPIRLADGVVFERRNRNVFHFAYSSNSDTNADRNDFHVMQDPFLAFAARCTSAFPFAFSPMRLDDIEEVLPRFPRYTAPENREQMRAGWKEFYKDYLGQDGKDRGNLPFGKRAFTDGGVLDNKPFTQAAETLLSRQANVRVERKLIYVEPNPANPETERDHEEKPDALQTVYAALLDLPRAETIREDLQRIRLRNQELMRVERIISGVEEDFSADSKARWKPQAGDKWADQDLTQMIKSRGIPYGAYHRLKVASVTEDVARLITRVAFFEEDSDQLEAVRYLVIAWRVQSYVRYHRQGEDLPAENRFLMDYDIEYRFRRLRFVQRKIDDLYVLDEKAVDILQASGVELPMPLTEDVRANFRNELLQIKNELNQAFVMLRDTRRRLWSPMNSPLQPKVEALKITKTDLEKLLDTQNEDERYEYASNLIEKPEMRKALDELQSLLAETLKGIFTSVSNVCQQALDTKELAKQNPDAPEVKARTSVRFYYNHYEDYDMVTFPVLSTQEACETNFVDIVRISPQDATSLLDERQGRQKLAGTTLSNFGALLKREWRVNDMMWGRLDAAERLITTLTPHLPFSEREMLLKQAQEAIIAEELGEADRNAIIQWMLKVLPGMQPEDRDAKALAERIKQETGAPVPANLDKVLRSCMESSEIREFLKTEYEVNRELTPETQFVVASRAFAIVGKILDGAARSREVNSSWTAWIARVGQIFAGLVQVAIPDRLTNKLVGYWLSLFYLVELFLIVVGWLLKNDSVQTFGFQTLGITVFINYVIFVLGSILRGKKYLRVAQASLVLIVAVLVLVGVRNLHTEVNNIRNFFLKQMRQQR